MRKHSLAAALAFALAFGGCAQLQQIATFVHAAEGQVVTPQAVWIAVNAFDAAEGLGTKYLGLPKCGTGPAICRDPAISASVITWIKSGRADRNQLKAGLRANPNQALSLVDVYNDLGNTTAQLAAALAARQ